MDDAAKQQSEVLFQRALALREAGDLSGAADVSVRLC